MKKYWTIIKNEVQRQVEFRVSIAAFVVGNALELFIQIIIWTAIFQVADVIKGYNYNEMISYVVIGWLFMFLTTNYNFENIIAKDIREGSLSVFLVKPISYLRFISARSIGRVMIALSVIVLQGIIYLVIFHDKLIFDLEVARAGILLLMLIFSYVIKFFFTVLIGLISFWINEINGIYFSSNMLIKFLSGAFFPISLLPVAFANFSLSLPFVYTFFVPTQLYLGKISVRDGLKGLAIELIWIVLLYLIIKFVWKKGLKKYEAVGI